MRIVSYNVNGLRAAMKRVFCEWLKTELADISLHETKTSRKKVDRAASL